MAFKNVVAIIRKDKLNIIIDKLQVSGVSGVSVVEVKGIGEYINTFSRNPLAESVKLELMIDSDKVDDVIKLVMDQANTGIEGDGIVAVHNIEAFYRIRDKQKLS